MATFGLTQLNFTANGNVSPRRFIVPVTGAGNGQLAIQASGRTRALVGISADFTRFPPGSPQDDGYVAIANEALPYHGPMEICNLDIGSTAVTDCAIPLTSDSDGKGLPVSFAAGQTTGTWVGAVPMRTCAASETIPVLVLSPSYFFPALA